MTILFHLFDVISRFVFPYWRNLFQLEDFFWKSIVFLVNRTRSGNNVGKFAHVHQFSTSDMEVAGCDSRSSISVSTSFPAESLTRRDFVIKSSRIVFRLLQNFLWFFCSAFVLFIFCQESLKRGKKMII
jgi:hypothetical protein